MSAFDKLLQKVTHKKIKIIEEEFEEMLRYAKNEYIYGSLIDDKDSIYIYMPEYGAYPYSYLWYIAEKLGMIVLDGWIGSNGMLKLHKARRSNSFTESCGFDIEPCIISANYVLAKESFSSRYSLHRIPDRGSIFDNLGEHRISYNQKDVNSLFIDLLRKEELL